MLRVVIAVAMSPTVGGRVVVSGITGPVVSEVDCGSGVVVFGEGMMKFVMRAGVCAGVTPSTMVKEGRRRTVVGWGLDCSLAV